MKRSVEASIAYSDAAWDRKRLWYDVISEAYYYAAPGLDPYLEGSGDETLTHLNPGQRRQDHLFDGTLPTDAEDHANELCSETFTAGQDWARLELGESLADGSTHPPARQREALQSATAKIFSAIHASNFYLALNTMAMDAVVAGTGLMKGGITSDAAALLDFDAVSQAEVALEPGVRGMVGGFHRKMDVTRDEIRAYWPDGEPPKDDGSDKRGKPTKYRVLEEIYYDIDAGLWQESIILRGQGRGASDLEIYAREYLVCPWICWRYALLPGEVQGRGPVFKAVPAARTINHAKRVRLETASIRAVPAFTYVGTDTFNPDAVEIGPGVFIPVGSNDPTNPTIRPLEMAGDVPLNEIVISDERQSIHETLVRNALPDPSGPVRYPTEILERKEDHLKKEGAPVLRMMEEVGRPTLRLVAYLMQEAGQLTELQRLGRSDSRGRPTPFRLDGTDAKVQFSNPLVQLQGVTKALRAFRWAQSVAASFGPQGLMAGVAIERGAEVTGKQMDIDERLIRSQNDQGAMLTQAMQGAGGAQQPAGLPPGGM